MDSSHPSPACRHAEPARVGIAALFSPAYVIAGLLPVLVGYSSAAAIVFQAAEAAGATRAGIASWMWALGIGMGVGTFALSLRYRVPVIVAWSTPGAALLATTLPGTSMAEAVGVFLFSSGLLTLCGITGLVDRIMRFVPGSLAAAMLAGVLVPFVLELFPALEQDFVLVGIMLAVYLASRRWLPPYAIPLTFVAGILAAAVSGQIRLPDEGLTWEGSIAVPLATPPVFDVATLIGVGIPLFIVTMASQNLPGVAVLRAHGYQVPASPLVGWTGGLGLVLGPFGGYAYNLSAITAAIAMGRDVHPEASRRYPAGYWCGFFYILAGIFGGAVAIALTALPRELVIAIAGLALLGTVAASLKSAFEDDADREAAMLTFVVTASGMSLFSIGAPFWGIVIGLFVHALMRGRDRRPATR